MRHRTPLFVIVFVLLAISVVTAPSANADTSVLLRLTINDIRQLENPDDDGGNGDYFPEIRIGNGPLERRPVHTGTSFNPSTFDPPWRFTHTATVPDNQTKVRILVRLWDEDGGLAGGDDKLDINPNPGVLDLELDYDIGTDTWTAPNIDPGDTLIRGNGDHGIPNAGDGRIAVIGLDIKRDSPLPDTDGDNIPDVIERFGVRDKDDTMLYDLRAMGANPCRKTVIVQADYMTGAADGHSHLPKPAAMNAVRTAFDASPVDPLPSCPFAGVTAAKGVDFIHIPGKAITEQPVMQLDGTYRAVRDRNLHKLLRPWAHYAIFAHEYIAGQDTSGWCCDDGKDFIVTLGDWRTLCVGLGANGTLESTRSGDDPAVANGIGVGTNRTCDSTAATTDRQILPPGTGSDNAAVGTANDQAATFMHELGHSLGLNHGGGDRTNYKPNYLSIMNYAFGLGVLTSASEDGPLRLDYSSEDLADLDRTQLVENDGIKDGADFTRWLDPARTKRFGPGTGRLNWNWTFTPAGAPIYEVPTVNVDINADDDVCVRPGGNTVLDTTVHMNDSRIGETILQGADGSCQSGPLMVDDQGRATVLTGWDDWANLSYPAGPASGSPRVIESGREIGFAEALAGELALKDFYDPDLATAKTVDKATALPGDTLNYRVKVTNVGRGDATTVRLTDTLPDGTATTRSLPNLLPAASQTETFTHTVACTAKDGAVLTNRAAVTTTNLAGGAEKNTGNNTGTAATTVKAPNLTLTAAATPSAKAAEAVKTTLTATNTGSATATNASLTYTLPQNVYYSQALDQGSGPKPTTVSGNVLTWQLGAMDGGASRSVEFTTRSSLLTVGGTTLTGQAKIVYGNANGCAYDPVTASATSTVTEVAPSRNPQLATIWATLHSLRTPELLARVQATDQRFDVAPQDGRLSQQEVSDAFTLAILQPRTLKAELLATYLNVGSRRINAATAVHTLTIERLGLRTVGDAARHAHSVLLLPPGSNVIRYTDATLALVEINSGLAERY